MCIRDSYTTLQHHTILYCNLGPKPSTGDYVHIYLGKERRKEHCAMIAAKVKLMVGLKEVQEQVSRRGWVTLPRWSSPTARPAPSGSSGSASCSQKSSS